MTTAVIIPVHNRPVLVEKAILSCQRQTLPVDQIIVVDDASTDDTPAVVERLARDDARIRFIRMEQNGGANRARNAGAAVATTTWLSFLDSDDQWFADKHRNQSEALEHRSQAIAAFTGIRYLLPDGVKDEPLTRACITLDDLRLMNFLGSTSTAMVRKDVFEKVGGFDADLPSCQDWDLWFRLREQGDFVLIETPLIAYDQTDVARISKNLARVLIGHRSMFTRAVVGLSGIKLRRVRAYHHVRIAQILLWDFAYPAKALAASARSLWQRPTRMGVQMAYHSFRAMIRV